MGVYKRTVIVILFISLCLTGCGTKSEGSFGGPGLPPGISATFTADNEWRVGQTATLNVTWGERNDPPLFIKCDMGGGTDSNIPGTVVEETSFTHTFQLTAAGTFMYQIDLGPLPRSQEFAHYSASQAREISLSINNPAYGSYTVEPPPNQPLWIMESSGGPNHYSVTVYDPDGEDVTVTISSPDSNPSNVEFDQTEIVIPGGSGTAEFHWDVEYAGTPSVLLLCLKIDDGREPWDGYMNIEPDFTWSNDEPWELVSETQYFEQ